MPRKHFWLLLLLSACTSAPLTTAQISTQVSTQNATQNATPPVPQTPLQLRYHRFVYGLLQAPAAPADSGQLVGNKLPWERSLIEPVALLAAASNEPGLNLMHELPVLAARGLQIALPEAEPALMQVGKLGQNDTTVTRQPDSIWIRRVNGGDEFIRMKDPVMSFDASGSARDLRMDYSEERVRLSGRSGFYEARRSGDSAVVETPRGRLTLSALPNGLKIESTIKDRAQILLQEEGTSLKIDRDGTVDDFSVTRSPDNLTFKSPTGLADMTVTRLGNRIEVKYPLTARNFSVILSPDKIEVDRWLWGSDTTITRKGNQLKIDRFLFQNDATITRGGKRLDRQHWSADDNAWLSGVQAPDYLLTEGNLTLRVTPTNIQLLAISLDNGFDVLL